MKLTLTSVALCLALGLTSTARPLKRDEASGEGRALLQFSDDSEPVWYTLSEKYELEAKFVKFVDVTETWEGHEERLAKVAGLRDVSILAYPAVTQQTAVRAAIARISTANQQSYLSTLTGYNNRHYRSTTGATASNWIASTISSLASGRSDITVTQFTHSAFTQKSVIAKFAGTTPSLPIVIFGAHLDSTAGSSTARAPGADDDGSGSVTLIEAFRVLIASGYTPRAPVEFHWYAGEEGGLLGSGAIAANYASAGKQVNAMINFDMTAYTPPSGTARITFITDRTNAALTTYLRSLVTAYNSIGSATSTCGYACSDHASWTSNGYPSAFPFEAALGSDNPVIHSSSDTVTATGFSWTHVLEFTKLALATAIELGA